MPPKVMLIGHADQKAQFLEALDSGRLHHAWLIAGPHGIGKRAFADWAAMTLLSGQADSPADHVARALVEAGSHPDHRVLEPPTEGKGSATHSILIDHVRELSEFLHSYPAIAPRRTLIVDSIDDMNTNTSNSFLKELEEPREKTVYLLVSHSPGRLLPTIRSRCRTLRMSPLSPGETETVLQAQFPELPQAELASLAQLANGAPGSVAALAGADLTGLETALSRISGGADPLQFARSVSTAAAGPRFDALLTLVPRRLAEAARRNPQPALFALYDEAQIIVRDALHLAYVPAQVALALADIMARAGRIQDSGPAR
ncbi:DNA polymerase III subunit delta' [Sandaracinobacteroides hominis]|uniref:DNA polymerase III subunit delta' n=1 Tax=Sandaracinobacteroides hominis TaxID=2780086 RepID=UPI0018F6C963|nr:DNA polymerase III subunit delta' [Sandaracinobacteroides hominis]